MLNINFVWIGDGPINPLGMLNLHAWCSKPEDWIVNIVWLPNKGSQVATPLDTRLCRKDPCPYVSRVNIVRLEDYLASDLVAERMPSTAGLIQALIDKSSTELERAYAIGDLTKSLLAGTAVGITLDLKIGPSVRAKKTPNFAETFNKFIYMERCGIVENQCMGSFDADYTKMYGEKFEAYMKGTYLTTLMDCTGRGGFKELFEQVTGMHSNVALLKMGRSKMHVNAKRVGWDFTTTGKAATVNFLDPANRQSAYDGIFAWGGSGGVTATDYGPFQVFQKDGWYNWRATSVKAENIFYVSSVLRHAYLNRHLYGIDFYGDNQCAKNCAAEYCKLLLQAKFWKTNE